MTAPRPGPRVFADSRLRAAPPELAGLVRSLLSPIAMVDGFEGNYPFYAATTTAGDAGRARATVVPTVVVGVSGALQNASVAVTVDGRLKGYCELERLTRVRRAGLTGQRLSDQVVRSVLDVAGVGPEQANIRFTSAESGIELESGTNLQRVDHHEGHATVAFGLSPFAEAAVLVCDTLADAPETVWHGSRHGVSSLPCFRTSTGLTRLYAAAAGVFGFTPGQEHAVEALARLGDGNAAEQFGRFLRYDNRELLAAPGWEAMVAGWLAEKPASDLGHRAMIASAFQRRLGDMLLSMTRDVRSATDLPFLCLGGGLFYNTWFTTLIREAGIFDDVFVAPNPGNAGAAIGAALSGGDLRPAQPVSPFLGPDYSAEQIKRTLDNCKLSYEVLDERDVIAATVAALKMGQMVGWFQGRMEWGHRALGNRSILASPLSPYVLDNLNVFLKHRERHRTYGLSAREEDVPAFFAGPPTSRYMEFEYRPLDTERLQSMLPTGTRALRVQTVPETPGDPCVERFRRLHEEFGAATGFPVLVNTSFNGFSEPMVCSPRDAIRVFFGTGLDLLVVDRFVVRK